MAKVGINGFGKIGRSLLRAMIERYPNKIIPVGINSPGDDPTKYLAYLFKYDSSHGRFYGEVCHDDKHVIINKLKIPVFRETDIKKIPWIKNNADYVADCGEHHLTSDKAKSFIQGSVKKAVLAYSTRDVPVYIFGVNECKYNVKDQVLSIASSTVNCLVPVLKIVHEKYGIREGLVTSISSVTSDQKILDGPSLKSWRYGRAALVNIIPSNSDVGDAIGIVFPDLKGKITGMEFRAPIPTVSVIDLTIRICRSTDIGAINDDIKHASKCSLSGILCYTEEQLVSTDFIGCTCSCVYDATASIQVNNNFVKLIAWCDNEYGYACRLADMLSFIHSKDEQHNAEEQKKKDCKTQTRKMK
ncbi:hypothetical protein GWI33_021727 [Rhynchophorus ferrugineus]|uniref:glyceraldehyde-3-phosphate dehydrogenase (NADP(+)) (phosphorylating) n=1 Tax=Rhynchophorus ferrugineus TaxID=354439 RepID=A0A834ITH0_RHYFE|nr:hypothetical protein GWI33_021727 [Rhynchophorus ferrugineus]